MQYELRNVQFYHSKSNSPASSTAATVQKFLPSTHTLVEQEVGGSRAGVKARMVFN